MHGGSIRFSCLSMYLHMPIAQVVWSPHGIFFVLAGFGNMAGDMDFWDRASLKKLGSNNASCTVKRKCYS